VTSGRGSGQDWLDFFSRDERDNLERREDEDREREDLGS
jgi:hypothetical protein